MTVVNATVSQLKDGNYKFLRIPWVSVGWKYIYIAVSICKSKTTVAICIIILIGYVLLVFSGAVFFILARSENNGKS